MDGKKFPVHRNVLMAVSPYFRAMFSSGFVEARSNAETPIDLPTITSVGLTSVLDCLYSGKLILSNESVYDVLPAAHMLQLTNVLESCVDFMIKGISNRTCFQNLKLAKEYELDELERLSDNFILDNFVKLVSSTEFKEMSTVEICRYLKDDKLKGQEIEVFRASKEWVEFDPDRRRNVTDVMQFINFRAISPESLADEVMKYEILKSDTVCFQMALDGMKYHSDLFSQPFNASSAVRGRETVVTIRAIKNNNTVTHLEMDAYVKSDIYLNDDKAMKSNSKELAIKLERTSISCVYFHNFLYLFGTDSDSLTSCAKRFDGKTGI